jgi:hypothetical protein
MKNGWVERIGVLDVPSVAAAVVGSAYSTVSWGKISKGNILPECLSGVNHLFE